MRAKIKKPLLRTDNRKSVHALLLMVVALLVFGSGIAMPAHAGNRSEKGMLAPEHTVRGTVVSAEDGQPLPGVNVVVKGTAIGTATDIDGNFSITTPQPTSTLVFTYVGFVTKEVAVEGRSVVGVELDSDIAGLDEVVVTALGIEREKRAISFGTTEVKGPELMQGGASNAATALYGKTTGVSLASNVSGPMGGINMTIRGIKSITGNNRPLFIVDGIPINDRNSGYGEPTWDYSTRDLGTGVNDINPVDIENISVLKGANAAALYGAQAANGVVLITTKKGRRKGGLGVEFSSTVMADRVAFLPEFQDEYGTGVGIYTLGALNDGYFDLDENGVRMYDNTSYSWGPKMDGQMLKWWDGQMRPYSPQPDNFKDMFETGSDITNSLALSNATSNAVYRIGFTRRDYTGTFPGVSDTRNTLSLTSNLSISTKLTTDIALNYYNTATHNPPPKLYVGYEFPRSLNTQLLKDLYMTQDGFRADRTLYPRMPSGEEQIVHNYLWKQLANDYDVRKDRVVGSLGVNYAFTNWLNLRLRGGLDMDSRARENKEPSTQTEARGASGYYGHTKWQDRVTYGEAVLQANRQLSSRVGLDVLAGASSTRNYSSETGVETNGGLVVLNWFSVSNSKNTRNAWATRGEDQTDALFGSTTLSWDDYLFLTATARNDWTSTLPTENNSYFYPSVGLSYVFSDHLTMPAAISMGQLRANYAEVGRGANRYQANRLYSYDTWESGIVKNSFSTTVPPLGLKPERKKEAEAGLAMAFLGDRVGFDLSVYNQRNIDQIIDLEVAPSSGASRVTVNAGEMTNNGFDLQLYGSPFRSRDFEWNSTLNISRNKNEVVSLWGDLEKLTLVNVEDNLFIEARPGRPYGEIWGYDHALAPDGSKLVDDLGYYVKDTELSHLGNTTPEFYGGFLNTFRYKSLSLTAVIDYRIGGDIISITNFYGNGTGKWKSTLNYRDEATGGLPYYIGDDGSWVQVPSHTSAVPEGKVLYHDGWIPEGSRKIVDAQGNVTYKKNDVLVPVYDAYTSNYGWKYGIYSTSIFDNTYAKLRELTLTWQIPARLLRKVPVGNVSLSVIGRNLMYLYKNVPNIDPESSLSTDARMQGYEYAYYPTSRSLGVRLSANF